MATEDVEEQVRARLRQLRFQRGLSLRALATAAGISAATLSRLETGERRLTLAHIARLAEALDTAPHDLLGPPRSRWASASSDGRGWEPVGPERLRGRRVYRIEIPTGHQPRLHSHAGRQWLYVLDGRIRLIVEDDDRVLTRGDATEFDTWRPHWLGAVGRTAQALAIFSPHGRPLRTLSYG